MFNGTDLTGWRGGDTYDHRKLMALTPEKRIEQIEKWNKTMKEHWRAEKGELINDGHGAYATTEKDYGDFELFLEYKTVPKADSGIYLRGVPQVQIWDINDPDPGGKLGKAKGSGGLWNNSAGAPGKDPLVLADKPLGEWNTMTIRCDGDYSRSSSAPCGVTCWSTCHTHSGTRSPPRSLRPKRKFSSTN